MKKINRNFLEIPLRIYRCTCVITWESTLEEIVKYMKEANVILDDSWKKDFKELIQNALGITMNLGRERNTDVFVWLKKKPTKCSTFGTLYHELYHATDHVLIDHNMRGERETGAYVYEYLSTECNKFFWK